MIQGNPKPFRILSCFFDECKSREKKLDLILLEGRISKVLSISLKFFGYLRLSFFVLSHIWYKCKKRPILDFISSVGRYKNNPYTLL